MSWRRYTAALMRAARQGVNRADELLMPRLCVFCGTECNRDEDYFCVGCEQDLPWLGAHCPRCAEPLPGAELAEIGCGGCQASPPPFATAAAPLRFTFPVDAAIRAFKFHRRLEYAPAFASILEARLAAMPTDIDALLPVPLHWRRQLRRGFNQAAELSVPLGRRTGLPVLDCVRRVRSTPYQSGLEAPRRRQSLRGAFAARRSLMARHVLIVDDVMTTGTTCRQLAVVALQAGAAKVSVLALARAGQAGLNT